jgi:ribosomal protein L37AE/L43A
MMEFKLNESHPDGFDSCDTIPRLTPDERLQLQAVANHDSDQRNCPDCNAPYFVGDLLCTKCGFLFSTGDKTKRINQVEMSANLADKFGPIGPAIIGNQGAIVFEIKGQKIELPTSESVLIGRSSETAGSPKPDVSLNAFGAKEYGLSRQHIRIDRHLDIIYVTDLESSNGTYLNSRILTPHMKRIIRSGDELRLGELKIIVRF